MEKEYKSYFLKKLQHLLEQQKIETTDAAALQTTIEQLSKLRWNVHANAPFGGPAQILEYLGRYTHKTAITAHRIKQITHTTISFTYKDYADGKKQKLMTLSHEEFLRRFEQHILPARFVRIRHGGYLAHNGKNHRIAAILLQLQLPKPMPKVIMPFSLQMLQRTGIDYSICPKCKEGKMEITASYLNHNGSLVNIKDLTRRRTKTKHRHQYQKLPNPRQPMTKQIITQTNKQPQSKNLGRGNYMSIATQCLLIATKLTATLRKKTARPLPFSYKTS